MARLSLTETPEIKQQEVTPCLYNMVFYSYYKRISRKTSNKRLDSNKSWPLIGAGCTGTLNLKNASNYKPLINVGL